MNRGKLKELLKEKKQFSLHQNATLVIKFNSQSQKEEYDPSSSLSLPPAALSGPRVGRWQSRTGHAASYLCLLVSAPHCSPLCLALQEERLHGQLAYRSQCCGRGARLEVSRWHLVQSAPHAQELPWGSLWDPWSGLRRPCKCCSLQMEFLSVRDGKLAKVLTSHSQKSRP